VVLFIAAMPFKKGQSGNPEGPKPREQKMFEWGFLDYTAIPAAVRKLYEIVTGEDTGFKELTGPGDRLRLQIDAAKALLAKAPERLANPDGGAIQPGVIVLPGLKNGTNKMET
jgi:hypothetical protein